MLIKDILRNIQLVMAARAKCDALQDVESRIPPPGYHPTPNTGPSATATGVHWELWTVSGCGVVKQFPTADWPDPSGGTMTQVVDEHPDSDPVAH